MCETGVNPLIQQSLTAYIGCNKHDVLWDGCEWDNHSQSGYGKHSAS